MYDVKDNDIVVNFQKLLYKNKYITFKEYNNFLEEYKDLLKNGYFNNNIKEIINNGYSYIEKHNEKFIEQKLIKEKDYFDRMFENIDSKINLDEEQRKAIINDEDYSLIIAGAGAGKTTTMAAKVKYLIDKCNVSPDKIVVISYTNKATNELEDRIKYEFNLPVDIMTFHSLGIKIVRKICSNPLKPVSEKEKKEIICNYIKDILFKDKNLLTQYVETFNNYSLNGYSMFSSGFINNYQNFNTFEEYFKDYKNRKQELNKDNLKEIITYRIENYLKMQNPRSIKNEDMRSKAEAKIANFLFINGIDYKYEEPFPEKVDQEKAYLPDFTIEVNDIPIYIEYYGLSTFYENGTLSEKTKKKYEDIRKKKNEFHKNKHNYYIELDYKENNNNLNYIQELKVQLERYGVKFKRKTLEEIYDQILDNNIQAEFFHFVNFCSDLISNVKADINRDHIVDIINNYIRKSPNTLNVKNEMVKEASLFIKLFNYYESQLIPKNKIDFDDMIYYANKYMTNVNSTQNLLNYDYIIIDEYQDISIDRYNFAKNISNISNAKVISVGDDWQTIFSFAGSRIDLFYKYSSQFPGAKKLFINNTYRNSQELINAAGTFVMRNPFQIKKYLVSNKLRNNPIKICYYEQNQYDLVERIIGQIFNNNPNEHIMILARKNKHIKRMLETPLFEEGIDTRIICKKYPLAIIDAMSIHNAKGLGADQVIVLNVTNTDFPCLDKNEFWLIDLFKPETFNEHFSYAEDRRIFYVALTRTKKDVYLLTPYDFNKRSIFISELQDILK